METTKATSALRPLIFFLALILNHWVGAGESCAAITCDCESLPVDLWKSVCKEREVRIHKQCKESKNPEQLFCAAHGPGASNLPLELKTAEVAVVSLKSLSGLNVKIASLYWSVHQDLYTVSEEMENRRPDQAHKILLALAHNIDSLFEFQQQVSVSLIAYEKESESVEAWDDYSSDTQDMAENILKAGNRVWKKAWGKTGEEVGEVGLRNRQLALALIKNAGKAYEHAAYAFGMADEHDNAARAWVKAAEVSGFLIEAGNEAVPDRTELSFLRYQRAARLYRASFHWVKDEREGEAENSLKKAQELFDGSSEPDMS